MYNIICIAREPNLLDFGKELGDARVVLKVWVVPILQVSGRHQDMTVYVRINPQRL